MSENVANALDGAEESSNNFQVVDDQSQSKSIGIILELYICVGIESFYTASFIYLLFEKKGRCE
jgi:hypothetical protein